MSAFDIPIDLLEQAQLGTTFAQYRGNISPPLDTRWHQGGWTSHFDWTMGHEKVTLDVFGTALRESSRWEDEPDGLYAGMHVVAEMKRTDRPKDWPFVNALGEELLQRRDPRGWLHLCDAETLLSLSAENRIPQHMLDRRPVLELAAKKSDNLRFALQADAFLAGAGPATPADSAVGFALVCTCDGST